MKGSKNNPTTRTKTTHKMVTSDVCEKCTEQCREGKRYIKGFIPGHIGRGVLCKKGK